MQQGSTTTRASEENPRAKLNSRILFPQYKKEHPQSIKAEGESHLSIMTKKDSILAERLEHTIPLRPFRLEGL